MSQGAATRHLGLDLGATNLKWAALEQRDGAAALKWAHLLEQAAPDDTALAAQVRELEGRLAKP